MILLINIFCKDCSFFKIKMVTLKAEETVLIRSTLRLKFWLFKNVWALTWKFLIECNTRHNCKRFCYYHIASSFATFLICVILRLRILPWGFLIVLFVVVPKGELLLSNNLVRVRSNNHSLEAKIFQRVTIFKTFL